MLARVAVPPNWKVKFLRVTVLSSAANFSSTPNNLVAPNPRLKLDPNLDAFLQDVDLSTKDSKLRLKYQHKNLEVVAENDTDSSHVLTPEEWFPFQSSDESEISTKREPSKSPAALFGSEKIGAVVLPQELTNAIASLIAGT